jgi:hypothetical protein
MAFQYQNLGFPNEASPTCSILEICRRLGRDHYRSGRRVTYLNKLIEQRGFPPPLPDMSTRKRDLIADVTVNSRWIRAAVEAWFDNFMPPEALASIDAAALAAAAAEMDDAAGMLGGLRLVGGREA